MLLKIKNSDYQKLITHAIACLPNEACGVIGGIRIENQVEEKSYCEVKKVFLLNNLDKSPDHFSIDPEEQFKAFMELYNEGLELLGNWHSHTHDPAYPSKEDIKLASDPGAYYLILSIADKSHPVLKSFSIVDNKVFENNLEIIE